MEEISEDRIHVYALLKKKKKKKSVLNIDSSRSVYRRARLKLHKSEIILSLSAVPSGIRHNEGSARTTHAAATKLYTRKAI